MTGRLEDEDAAAVLAAFHALDEAFARHDLDAVLGVCTKDVVFIGSGAGEEAVGRDAIAPMFAKLAPRLDGLQFDLEWESVDVDVRGKVALVTAWGSAKLVTPNRDETLRYRLTGVLVRVKRRWLWRVHHGSEPASW
jgi:uncharacterized protein (TIGR02246 family)